MCLQLENEFGKENAAAMLVKSETHYAVGLRFHKRIEHEFDHLEFTKGDKIIVTHAIDINTGQKLHFKKDEKGRPVRRPGGYWIGRMKDKILGQGQLESHARYIERHGCFRNDAVVLAHEQAKQKQVRRRK